MNRTFAHFTFPSSFYDPSLRGALESDLLSIILRPPRWRRGSGLDFGSQDPGSIPRLPSREESENYKMKNSCPQRDSNPLPLVY